VHTELQSALSREASTSSVRILLGEGHHFRLDPSLVDQVPADSLEFVECMRCFAASVDLTPLSAWLRLRGFLPSSVD
jgi:hypothetical protein